MRCSNHAMQSPIWFIFLWISIKKRLNAILLVSNVSKSYKLLHQISSFVWEFCPFHYQNWVSHWCLKWCVHGDKSKNKLWICVLCVIWIIYEQTLGQIVYIFCFVQYLSSYSMTLLLGWGEHDDYRCKLCYEHFGVF